MIIPTSRVKKVIEISFEEARRMGNNYVGTEHLLLGLLIEGEGIAAHVLEDLGANLEKVRGEIDRLLHESGLDEEAATAKKPSKTPLLDQFCRDLTDLAAKNTLDPVIGRETEIERVVQILSRRTKNNPALIGEPGVGKTAIAEGLARSEEHTSELQSPCNLVCRLLLEKKKHDRSPLLRHGSIFRPHALSDKDATDVRPYLSQTHLALLNHNLARCPTHRRCRHPRRHI